MSAPSLGVVVMTPQTCTYTSNEEKANALKEAWTKPTIIADLKDLDVVEDVLMGSGLGPGAIAAIVIVSLLVVAGSIIGGICYYKKKRSCNTVAILTDADNKDLEAAKS